MYASKFDFVQAESLQSSPVAIAPLLKKADGDEQADKVKNGNGFE